MSKPEYRNRHMVRHWSLLLENSTKIYGMKVMLSVHALVLTDRDVPTVPSRHLQTGESAGSATRLG